MALKKIKKNGRIYSYNGNILVSVTKDTTADKRAETAQKTEGKSYRAGKGLVSRGTTSKTYKMGMSEYAAAKKDLNDAGKKLDSLYEEQYKIQQLEPNNKTAIDNVNTKINKAKNKLSTAESNFETAKNKRYFDRQTIKFDNESKKPGFAENSKYKGKVTTDNLFKQDETAQIYAYINDPEIKKYMDTAAFAGSNGTKDSAYPNLKYMDKKEVETFNSLYNTRNDGGKTAKSYIDDYLSYALNERYYANAEAEAQKFAEENPVGASAASVAQNVFGGLGYLDVGIQRAERALTGSEAPIDWNTNIMANTYARATKTRETVGNSIDNPVLRDLYYLGMSMADSAASMPMGGTVGPAFLGMSAGTDAMKDAKANGATDDQAMVMGFSAASLEFICEKIGFDNLFKIKNVKGTANKLKTIFKQGAVEGIEEPVTTLGNTAVDLIVMGDKSELARMKQSYIDQGYSEAEAEKMAMSDWSLGLAKDAAGGFISGTGFGGAAVGIDSFVNKVKTPTINKYAGTEAVDEVLNREYKTNYHQIENLAGEDVATSVENSAQVNNPGINNINADTVVSEVPQAKNHYANIITEQKAADLYRSVENRTGLRVNVQNLGENINGYISNNEIVVNEKIANTEEGARFVVAHELTHTTESLLESEETKQLYNDVLDSAKTFYGDNFNVEVQNRINLYAANGVYLSEVAAQKEVVADFIANEVLSDYSKLKNFVDNNRSLAQRIFEWIKSLLRNLAGKNDVLVKAYNNFEKAFNEANIKTETEKLDAEYMAAVNRGDMETAQRIVDEVANIALKNSAIRDKNGKLIKVYHGSPFEFNVFRDRNDGEFGVYFSPWKTFAEGYGKAKAFYLNIENPITYDDEFNKTNEVSEDVADGFIYMPEDMEGGIDQKRVGDTEIVAYSSNQIKSADTVVYDDNGNIILPSHRFNEKSNDIRYSSRDVKLSKEINEGVMPPNDVVFEIRYSDAMANPEIKKLYNDAKKGDLKAAAELVKKLISKDTIERFRAYGPDVKIIAASASILDSDNVIPVAVAQAISDGFEDIKGTGQEVIDWVFKVPENKKSRETSIWDRMKEPYPEFDMLNEHGYNEFEGSIVALVDDNATTGRTFNGLRLFIEAHGGKIIGYYSLTAGHDESEKMAVTSETWAKLEPVLDEITAFAKKEGIKREITKTGLTEREANELYTRFEKTQTGTLADRSNGKMLQVQAEGSERNKEISINESETTKDGGFSIAEKSQEKTDSEGRALTEAQAEYFKDSKVRDADGNLKVMYRGDQNDFTVFDRKKSSYANLYGRGFYFTDSASHAGQYGAAREFYLDIKRPVSTTETTITKEQLTNFVEAVAEDEDYGIENYGEYATVESVVDSVYGKTDFQMLYDISQTAIGDMVAAVELFNEVNGTDFDGLILDTETVTFRSEQAKLANNKKPTTDKDIRLSITEEIPKKKRSSKSKADLESLYATETRQAAPQPQKMSGANWDSIMASEPPVTRREKAKQHAKKYDGTQEYERYKDERLDTFEEVAEKGYFSKITVADSESGKTYNVNLVWNKYLPRSAIQIKKYNKQHYGVDTKFIFNGKDNVESFRSGDTVYLNMAADKMLENNSREVFRYLADKYQKDYNRLYDAVLGFMKSDEYAQAAAPYANIPDYETRDLNIISDFFADPDKATKLGISNAAVISKELKFFKDQVLNKVGAQAGKNKNDKNTQEYREALFESAPPEEQEQNYFLEDYVSPEEKQKEKLRETVNQVDLPPKAKSFYDKRKKALFNRLCEVMAIPVKERGIFKESVDLLADEMLFSGNINKKAVVDLARYMFDHGVEIDQTAREENKNVFDYLSTTKVKVTDQVKKDIEDFKDFRRNIFGYNNLLRNEGVSIHDAYAELNEMNQTLFPDSISNETDMLLQMVHVREMLTPRKVSVKERGADYKHYAMTAYGEALNDFYNDIKDISNFYEDYSFKENVMKGTEEIGYVNREDRDKAKERLSEVRKEFAAWKKEHMITSAEEAELKDAVAKDKSLDSIGTKTISGRKIRKEILAEALPYITEITQLENIVNAYRRQRKARFFAEAKLVTQNSDLWKDKRLGIQYMRETQRRNILDIAEKTDPEGAAMFKKMILDSIEANEAEAQRFINSLQDRMRAYDLNKVESFLVQAYGEELITAETLAKIEKAYAKNAIPEKVKITNEAGEILYEVKINKPVDAEKVKAATAEMRYIYDMLIKMANDVLVDSGYQEKPILDHYFPHFSTKEGFLKTAIQYLTGIDISIDETLPESINGISHTFKPGKTFFSHFLHRTGEKTDIDALLGFDMYLSGIKDVIFHTEDIQKLRAVETVLRQKHADEEIRNQIKEIWKSELTRDEQQSKIDDLLKTTEGNLSNYVVNLSDYIDYLTHKKHIGDRFPEHAINRKIYAALGSLESRISLNMMGSNLGSWLTNFIPLVQMKAQVKRGYMGKALVATIKSWRADDGFAYRSDFLVNRRGNNPLVRTPLQMMADYSMKPMEWIDNFVTEVCCRAVYLEQIDKGKSPLEALNIANERTADVVADRSYGQLPTIFNAKNPFFKTLTMFQVEVNNQFSNMFKDLPRRAKEEGLSFIVWALIKYFIGAALFNDLYEKLTGRRPAFDPIGMIKEGIETYQRTESAGDTTWNVVSNSLEQVPFVGGLFGGGRVPISSAIPYDGNIQDLIANAELLGSDEVPVEKKTEIWMGEFMKPVYYLFAPTSGGAVKKALEGYNVAAQGGLYTYDKEGNKSLKFASNQEAGDFIRNMLFGRWSSAEAQEYIKESKMLSPKDTATFDALKEMGVKPTEAYDIVREISDIQGVEGVKYSKAKDRMEAIDDLDVSDDVKYQLYYDMVISDSKKEDFDVALNDYGMNKADLMKAYASTYGITGAKDEETGKTISGSKSAKVKDQIDNIDGLNEQQTDYLYETFDVGKKARGLSAEEEQQLLSSSVIPEAAGYELPNYTAKKKQKLIDMGVSANDYAYIEDRIGAYEDKVDYLKSFNFSSTQLESLVEDLVMGDTAKDKMLVADERYGISSSEYIQAYMYGYSTVGTKSERNAQIQEYVSGLNLTDEQKAALYDYIKVYKKKNATGSESASGSSSGGRSSGRRKVSVPSAPSIAVKKVSGATRSNNSNIFKNLAERQKKADYEAQMAAINNNLFMTAAQKAAAKRRLARQFNM